MKLTRLFSCFDFAVILLAALLPTWFVLNGFGLLGATGWPLFSIANSYAVIVIAISAIASLGRRFATTSPMGGVVVFKGRMALSFLTVCVAAFLIWNMRTVEAVPLDEIVSPYVSYLISVLFSAGTGYALAHLAFGIYQFFGGKK